MTSARHWSTIAASFWLALPALAVIGLYSPHIASMMWEWSKFPTLSHGFAIAPIAAYLICDHWYRLLLFYNRVVRRRAEGALVRIASPIPEGVTPAAVLATQTAFLEAFYPDLLRSFAR